MSTNTESAISRVSPLKARSPKWLTFDLSVSALGMVQFMARVKIERTKSVRNYALRPTHFRTSYRAWRPKSVFNRVEQFQLPFLDFLGQWRVVEVRRQFLA